jgi:hypothetical protein
VTAADRYTTPMAFRRALTDRLKSLTGTSRWTMPQLQRHVAYDRLLERLYQFDRNWVVKGATALMARELGTRGTLDIDLYREISLAAAEATCVSPPPPTSATGSGSKSPPLPRSVPLGSGCLSPPSSGPRPGPASMST